MNARKFLVPIQWLPILPVSDGGDVGTNDQNHMGSTLERMKGASSPLLLPFANGEVCWNTLAMSHVPFFRLHRQNVLRAGNLPVMAWDLRAMWSKGITAI